MSSKLSRSTRTRQRLEAAIRRALNWEGLEARQYLAMTAGGVISSNAHWLGTVDVASSVTLSPGVTLTVDPGTVIKTRQRVFIDIQGTLDAHGTAANPIIFTSNSDDSVGEDLTGAGTSNPQAGAWRYLAFEGSATGSVLQNVEVRYGGNRFNPGNGSGFEPTVQIVGSNVSLDHVKVLNSDGEAVRINGGTPSLTSVAVDTARGQAFDVDLGAVPIYSALSASNTALNGMQLNGGTITDNRTWDFGGLAVRLSAPVTIGGAATLSIVPGQVVKLGNGGFLQTFGNLSAPGTAEKPIIFTSFRDDSAGGDTNADGASSGAAGDWRTLFFEDSSDASAMTNVQVRFAGNRFNASNGSGFEAALQLHTSNVSLTNVQVQNSDGEGINISGGTPKLNSVSINQARSQAFDVDLSALPTYSGLSATSTGLNGVQLGGGTISADRTWDFGGLPVQVASPITVAGGATLSIIPGQVVKFYNGGFIDMGGNLNALATAQSPVIFTSWRDDSAGGDTNADGAASNPAAGDWRTLFFEDGSDGSSLANVQVRYAGNRFAASNGSGFESALQLRTSDVKLNNVQITDSDGEGINISSGAPTLAGVSISRARSNAFHADLDAAPALSNLSAAGTGGDRYVLDGGTLNVNRTWDFGGMPLEMNGSLTVSGGHKLTIVPGSVIKMSEREFVQIDGTLDAEGTTDRPIIFTSYKDDTFGGDTNHNGAGNGPQAGDWRGFFFDAGSDASILQNVQIRYPGNRFGASNGSGFEQGMVIDNASITLRHVQLATVDGTGIRIQSGHAAILDDVHVEGARGVPFSLDLASNPSLSGLTEADNGVDAIAIDGGALPANRTFNQNTIPYVLGGSVAVPAGVTFTVNPGAVVKLTSGQYIDVFGTLNAAGTLTAPITFTSRQDDSALGDTFNDGAHTPGSGDWRSIFIEPSSTGTVLDHVDLKYAGNRFGAGNGSGFETALNIINSSPAVHNTRVLSSDGTGMQVTGGGTAVIDQVTVDGARQTAFVTDLTSAATWTGLRAVNNGANSVFMQAGGLPGDRTFDFSGLPLEMGGSLAIPQGRTLTIAPGQVLKFSDGEYLDVSGTLNAAGTAEKPIVFTASQDDSAGGDSNNDGAASTPRPGNWRGIFFESDSGPSVLDTAQVRFAGNRFGAGNGSGFEQSIWISGAAPTLKNLQVTDSDGTGIRIQGSSTPTLNTVDVQRSRGVPYSADFATNPTLTNITASNNGVDAYALDGGGLPGDRELTVTTLPYILGNSVSTGGRKLTIDPGVVVKLTTGQYIDVQGGGSLDVNGSASNPVIFTSRADDSAGGDTFHNGTQPTPAGDWYAVFVDSGAGAVTLDNMQIRYAGNRFGAGNGSGFTASLNLSGDVTATNLTVRDSDGTGILLDGNAKLNVTGGSVGGSRFTDVQVNTGTATLTNMAIISAPTGIGVNNGAGLSITGSGFENTNTTISTGNKAFGNVTATGNWFGDPGGPNDTSNADGRINANPAGEGIGDFVDYSNFLTSRPPLPLGPVVLSHAPQLSSADVASIDVTFSDPIDLTTFTPDDVTISGPQAATAATITQVVGTTYRITFNAPLTTVGDYQIKVGPNLAGVNHYLMDQNRNGAPLEIGDAYIANIRIERTGARIISATPTGSQPAAVDHVDVTFSEPINAASFTPSDIVMTGPKGAVQVLSVTQLSPTQFRIGFGFQSVNGSYSLTIGPNVSDLAGNLMDQNQNGTNAEPADTFTHTFTVARQPLRIVGQTPSGIVAGALGHVDVTFSAPILAGTFGVDDVSVISVNGLTPVLGVTPIDATTYRVTFQTLTAEGDYTIRIGPEISDPAGNLMDQDGDGTPGEPEDRYEGSVHIDNAGPLIVSQSVNGTVKAPVSSIDVTFSEAIQAPSFDATDVVLVGPAGAIAVTGVSLVSGNTYRISFAAQTLNGGYSLAVGPNVLDLSGQAMNQDLDGINGEATQDVYHGAFSIDSIGPKITGTSPAGTILAPFSTVTLTFSEGINAASFGLDDVVVTGPNGVATVSSVTSISATQFKLTFSTAQSVPGAYHFVIGPQVLDLVGNAMDQNSNGIAGEVADAYTFDLTLNLPDLTIDTVNVPASVASGDPISITWSDRNIGQAVAHAPWVDRVILSKNDVLGDGDDIVLGDVTTLIDVAGDALARSVNGQIPFGLSGAFTLFIRTDAGGGVLEGFEGNNVYSTSITIAPSTPPADLQVDAVTVPLTGLTGQPVAVTWRVTNHGTATTSPSAWSDRIYLSTDANFGDANDLLLATVAHNGALAPNANYAGSQNLTLPANLAAGTYFIFVQTDAFNEVLEPAAEGNNVGQGLNSISVSLGQTPDLQVATVTTPAVGGIGQQVTVNWTVKNAGLLDAAGPWNDRVYLSTDGTLNGAQLLGTFTFNGTIGAGQQASRSGNVVLPVVDDSDYFIVVVTDADNQIFERNAENNNLGASAAKMHIAHPDLRIDSVTAPVSAQSSQTISVSWVGRNGGTFATGAPWIDRVYLSTDGTLSGDDITLGELAHSGTLAPGDTYNAQLQVTLPGGISGNYRILVKADPTDQVNEDGSEGNNVTASAAFPVALSPYADLQIHDVTAQPLVIGDPVDLTVSWQVSNIGTGTGTVASWTDKVVLSRNNVFGDGDDIVIGTFQHDGLMPVGSQYTQTQIISLAAATQGRFTLFVQTDSSNAVYEFTDTGANIGDPGHPVDVVTRPYADLTVSNVVADSTVLSGQKINISYTVTNGGIGLTDTTAWTDQVYMSPDPTGATGMRYLGGINHVGALGVGASYVRNGQVTIPSDASGTQYLFVITGGPFEFIYTDNNSARSNPVNITFVPPPPLDLEVTSVSGPTTALDSSNVEVTWTVKNNGPTSLDTSTAWTDTVYLVQNGDFAHAIRLGDFRRTQGLEAGKTYTRTELVRLPTTQGFFQFFVQTDRYAEIIETNEGNNLLASSPLTLTLRPRADLQVGAMSSPVQVTAGAVVDVSFTVKNLGTAATPTGGSHWRDGVYLSGNNTWDGSDILLGAIDNGFALGIGEAYSSSGHFTLPKGYSGNAFIIVKTDIDNAVDEFPQEGNNTQVRALAIDSVPVPPPDLVTFNVFTPISSFDNSNITVHYEVANRGAGPTFPGSWGDQVWLTVGKGRPNPLQGDIYLGSFGNSSSLDVGQSYARDVSVHLPANTQGQYYITVFADASDSVYEASFDVNRNPDAPNDLDGSNFKSTPITVFYTPPADLQVTSVVAPPVGVGGNDVTLTWTVTNKGSVPTDRGNWADAIYVSTDDKLHDGKGEEHLVFVLPHTGVLNPFDSYTQTATFQLPPSALGSNFIVETNVDPRLGVTGDDLFLQAVSQAEGGGDIDVQSLIDKLTGSDGQFRQVFEGPFGNNNQRAAASNITNTPADLAVSNVSVDPTAFSGENVTVNWRVTNNGGPVWSGTQSWVDYIFLSPDPNFIYSRATLLGTKVHSNVGGLGTGEFYNASQTLALPAGIEGKKYVYVFTDRNPYYGLDQVSPQDFPYWPQTFRIRTWETAKENNVSSASTTVTFREPDLQIVSPSVPATGGSGGDIHVGFTVKNQGTRITRVSSWYDRVYISMDQSLDDQDQLLGTIRHDGALAPGGSYDVATDVRLPDNITGPFYILIYPDSPYGQGSPIVKGILPYPRGDGGPRVVLQGDPMGQVKEFKNEANDILALPIDVHKIDAPDLKVTQVSPDATAIVGRGFNLTYQITNVGLGMVPDRQNPWDDSIYLSRDPYLDVRSDILLKTIRHDGILNAGQGYSITTMLDVPRGILGPYYVFVLTDIPARGDPKGIVIEADESNNATASPVPMIIELPPPSDLQVDNITVPSTATAGSTVSISYTVSNHSPTESATGHWSDSLYLSKDGVWDLGDQLIATVDRGALGSLQDLAPGQSYTGSINANLPIALPDSYRIIVRTDVFDDINEGAFNNNNTSASNGSINVTVKTLQLNVPADDVLFSGNSILYRVQVSGGQTLEISLDADNDGAANELYAKFEGLPSSQNADASFTGHLTADQKLIIPTTQAGFYYILARSAGGSTAVHLKARIVPFGINDITPDAVGDSRYVTTTITGAQFSPSAIVKLVRPGFGEYEPVNYHVVDATRIVATFDLRNAPHGLYDLIVTNPDGQTARVPYRFLIEQAKPLDVTVGMGGPSHLDPGQTGVYGVTLHSITNVDAPYIHFEFGVPRLKNSAENLIPGERLVFSTNLSGHPEIAGVPWDSLDPVINDNGDLEAPGFNFDLINTGSASLTFTADIYPEVRKLLAENPKFLDELTDDEKQQLAFDFYIQAAATAMSADEYVAFQKQQALSLRDKILADDTAPRSLLSAVANADAWTSAYLAALTDSGQLRPQDEPPAIRITPLFSSIVSVAAAGILGQTAGQPIIDGGDLVSFFKQVRAWYGNTPDAYGSADIPDSSKFDLHLSSPTHFEAFKIHVGVDLNTVSVAAPDADLNDFFGITGSRSSAVSITGPSGAGSANYVPAGTNLPYSINFSNPGGSASTIAQIRILQPIDPALDVRTFQLGDLKLGDTFIDIPAGRGAFNGTFDLTATKGYVLSVSAGVDVVSHTATWLLTAIDPLTGLPINTGSGLSGLLPAGTSGSVGYTIRTDDSAHTGDLVKSSARIIYDNQTPLDTNTITATVDAAGPTTDLTVTPLGNGSYSLSWLATDDALGSGVQDHSVYVSLNGGAYQILAEHITDNSYVYTGKANQTASFLVISADLAGNVETGPNGIFLPPYNPLVNLGTLPEAPPVDQTIQQVTPTSNTPTNPLFIHAQLQVPSNLPTTRKPSFNTVFEPFTASSFVTHLPQSGAGIGAISMAFGPDQFVYLSGGANRNVIYKFNLAGGDASSAIPLASLDTPIYDMTFDSNGHLWATTGGGPLVQIDPSTGAIVGRYSDSISLGLVAVPGTANLYVSTSSGIAIFNTTTHIFTPFSSTRVDGLALAGDGTLYGATWPHDGQIVKFDRVGHPLLVADLADPVNGLAFGATGSPLDGLLLASHSDGTLSMIELASLKSVTIASGGTRSEFIHVGPDGKIYVTQSDELDVFSPITNPKIIASNPVDKSQISPVVNSIRLTFDLDMIAGSDTAANSVTNINNYTLTDTTTGQTLPIGLVTYDPVTRTARLFFESLLPDKYSLAVSSSIGAQIGTTLDSDYSATFNVIQDVSGTVSPHFSLTRFNRQTGMLSFDVDVTNTLPGALSGPVRLVFDGITGNLLQGADGLTADNHPYIDLVNSTSTLNPNQKSATRTLSILLTEMPADLIPHMLATVAPNQRPVFSSTPTADATANTPYSYTAHANDPDGPGVTYVLVQGPQGATVDPDTGAITWTPGRGDPATAQFELRAYDQLGGFARQTWSVTIAGVNQAPIILPIADQTINEGQLLEVQVGAIDPDGDPLIFWADHLPAGATFDPLTHTLRYRPDGRSAGRYTNIRIFASDGTADSAASFEILVLNVNQPPALSALVARTINEGDRLSITLGATDVDGDAITYSALNLPAGATLDPVTGLFDWTPDFSQHGNYAITFTASDGQGSTTQTLNITVNNANGPVKFPRLGKFITYEGQTFALNLQANDPDNPAGGQVVLGDGTVDGSRVGGTLIFTHTALPPGATFDADTQTLLWNPTYTQAGTYSVTFTVTDDGDGTGVTTTDSTTIQIEVRDSNAPPVIGPVSNKTTAIGTPISFNLTASDPDGGPVILSAQGLPAWATLVDHHDGTATISGTPGYGDRGNYTITFSATDNGNGNPLNALTTSAQFILSATAINEAPSFQFIGDKVAIPGQELVFKVIASDPDQNFLTYSSASLPAGATFLPTSVYGVAEFRWTPTAADAGAHTITLRVDDDADGNPALALFATQSFKITVRAADAAPILLPVGAHTGTQEQALNIQLKGVDADNDSLAFFASDLPRGATLNTQSGLFSWTPDALQSGLFTVTFGVTDGNKTSQETVSLTIDQQNHAPVLAPLPPQTTDEGIAITFTIGAGDIDGDTLTYSASNLPAGATFDPTNQTFTWTPGYDQAGDYSIHLTATDSRGLSSSIDAAINVANSDRAPVLPILSAHSVQVGKQFKLTIPGSDPDHDTLIFSATGLPAGATLNPTTGQFTWTPSAGQVGTQVARITISDGSLTASQNLTLVTSFTPAPPAVLITLTPSFAQTPGNNVLIHATASGVADIANIKVTINGQPQTLDAFGRVNFVPTAPGHYTIVATATDIDGLVGTTTTDLKVRDPADTIAPVVSFDPPSGRISAPFNIRATVSDTNLDYYRLEIAPLGSTTFNTLATGIAPVASQVLASIDPASLANGSYTLRLVAADISGRTTIFGRVVEVNSTSKSAAFSTSVTDLSTTLDGVPITITRNYSSLTPAAGTFGIGWTLGGIDPQISSTLQPTGDEGTGVFAGFSDGTRLYFTLPDGSRAGFTFTPTKVTQGTVTFYRPAWVADAGVNASLTTASSDLQLVDGVYYQVGTGLPYNPGSGRFGSFAYTLTAPGGNRYVYDAAGRLNSITANNGKRLAYSDSGLVAPSGARLAFSHDSAGRLTDVIASDGTHLHYTYDAQGRLAQVNNLGAAKRTLYGYHGALPNLLTEILAPTGQASSLLRYSAAGLFQSSTPIGTILGATRQFLNQPRGPIAIAAGQTDTYAFVIGENELSTSPTHSITIALDVTGAGGFNPAVATINGVNTGAISTQAGHTFALFTINSAGPYVITIAGANGSTAGTYTLTPSLAGDLNGDLAIDGVDANLFPASPNSDIDHDGSIDASDRVYLDNAFGFVANHAPTVTARSATAHRGSPISIDLSTLASDPEGDPLNLAFVNIQHGQLGLAGDGLTAIFTPDANFTGDASFDFRADDGSLSSSLATFTLHVSGSALRHLQLKQRDIQLNKGQSINLSLIGEYDDGQTVNLPASSATYISLSPSIVQVTDTGALLALTNGTAIIKITVDGITAVTPVTVGTLANPTLQFFPDTYTITLTDTRQMVIREKLADNSVASRSAAAAGAKYFLSDPAMGTITADGLFTPTALGAEDITMVYAGHSFVASLTIENAVTTTPANPARIGSDGGVAINPDGIAIGAGPGVLPDNTPIKITPIAENQLPGPIPTGFTFGGAFNLDLGGAVPTDGLSLSFPAPAGTVPGQPIYIMRRGSIVTGPGQTQDMWELVDSMVVGNDGRARSTSPPYPSLNLEGTMVFAIPNLTTLAFATASLATRASYGQVQTGDDGTPYYTVPTILGDFFLPISGFGSKVKIVRVAPDGNLSSTDIDNLQIAPGQIASLSVTVPNPPFNRTEPSIVSFDFNFVSGQGRVLTINGANFDPDPDKNDILFLPHGTGTGVQPTDTEINLFAVHAKPYFANSTTLKVVVPAGFGLGGSVVAVQRQDTNVAQVPSQGAVSTPVWTKSRAELVKFSAPHFVYVANEADNSVSVIDGTASTPAVIAQIPVGQGPTHVAVSTDGLRLFVSNTAEGTISVIDTTTLQEIDLFPDNQPIGKNFPGITRLKIPGGHPDYIVAHPFTNALGQVSDVDTIFVADRYNGNVYTFFSNIDESAQRGIVPAVKTLKVDGSLNVHGLTGIGFSNDGKYAYVASTGNVDQAGADSVIANGYVFVLQISDGIQRIDPRIAAAPIITGAKPFGVVGAPAGAPDYVAVDVRGSEAAGYVLIDPTTQSIVKTLPTNLRHYEPQVNSIGIGLGDKATLENAYNNALFDIRGAQAMAFTPDGSLGFVLFRATYNPGDPGRDPNSGRGGNIGIIENPFDPAKARFIGATREVPFSWPDDITIGPDGRYLYASYTGVNAVRVYDIDRIQALIEILRQVNPDALNTPRKPLEDYAADVVGAKNLSSYLKATATSSDTDKFNDARSLLGDGNLLVANFGTGGVNPNSTVRVLDPNAPPNSGKTIVIPRGLPKGLASGPQVEADFIAGKAVLIRGDINSPDFLKFTYTVLGKTPSTFTIGINATHDLPGIHDRIATFVVSGADAKSGRTHIITLQLPRKLKPDDGLI